MGMSEQADCSCLALTNFHLRLPVFICLLHTDRAETAFPGQVGAGVVTPPMNIFEDALVAFAEKYGI